MDVVRNGKIVKVSKYCVMSERKRDDMAFRQNCEGVLLALPGKNKVLLVNFANCYSPTLDRATGEYQRPAVAMLCLSTETTSGTATAFGVTA